MDKCHSKGKPGMNLHKAFCRECDDFHLQWKMPCENNCEDGKFPVEPLGYTTCNKCNGRGYQK